MVELRVRKERIDRYLTNLEEDNDKLLQYLRRKIGDELIYKILPIISKNDCDLDSTSYMIIRHPLQDIDEFSRVYNDLCMEYNDQVKFIRDHIELFNNLEFVIGFSKVYPTKYQYLPERFKSNKIILQSVIYNEQFQYFPDKIKNDRNLVIYLILLRGPDINSFMGAKNLRHHTKIRTIFQYLPYEFRKDPEIVSLAVLDILPDCIYMHIIAHIPDNLINDRNFVLSLNIGDINVSTKLCNYLSLELKRDYDILLKHGYSIIGYKLEYDRIMTPEMKSDVELHKKLIYLNPNIYYLMSEELKNIIPKNNQFTSFSNTS
jgi:hypothetical protein